MESRQNIRGWVCFYNQIYGFVECENGKTYFFHKSEVLIDSRQRLQLLSKVAFKSSLVTQGKHIGKEIANEIEVLSAPEVDRFQLFFGTITKLFHKHCVINSPNLEKETLFFFNRSIHHNETYSIGSSVLFSPVISSKTQENYFALFAYPLVKEYNIKRLYNLLEKAPASRSLINQVNKIAIKGHNADFLMIKFKDEWSAISEDYDVSTKKDLIQKYAAMGLVIDSYYLESAYDEKELIFKWETKKIQKLSRQLILKYFVGSGTSKKRDILIRLGEESIKLLEDYFEYAKRNNLFASLLNVRLFFEVTIKPDKNIYFELHEKAKQYILPKLSNEQIEDLIKKSLLSNDSDYELKTTSKLAPITDIQAYEPKTHRLSDETINQILHGLITNYGTENWPNSVIFRLRHLHNLYPGLTSGWIAANWPVFSDLLKLRLFIHEISTELLGLDETTPYTLEINLFEKLILSNKTKDETFILGEELSSSLEEEIKLFINAFVWDELFAPVAAIDDEANEHAWGFLDELLKFCQYEKLNLFSFISLAIFDNLPENDVYRVRIWLKGYVLNENFNYEQFKSPFKQLTKKEKAYFKSKSQNVLIKEQRTIEHTNLLSSKEPVVDEMGNRTYILGIENCYFEKKQVRIKMEDGELSDPYSFTGLSSGFNRLSMDTFLNSIKLHVKFGPSPSKKILEISGLKELIDAIIRSEIERSLSRFGNELKSRPSSISYAENYELRKKAIAFLNDHQLTNFEIVKLHEPKNNFRRLDDKSGVDEYQLTGLFTLAIEDSLLLVWENLDLDDDRATYLFKCKPHEYDELVRRISKTVTSHAQIRSTLSTQKSDDYILNWKEYLCFIGSLRKPRLGKGDLQDWINKIYRSAREAEVKWVESEPEFRVSIKRSVNWGEEDLKAKKLDSIVRTYYLPELNETTEIISPRAESSTLNLLLDFNSQLSEIKASLNSLLN